MIDYNTIRHLDGWLEPQVLPIVEQINEIQKNLKGNIVEIGVHHGKFFIPLVSCLREGEMAFAVDIFEKQSENISKSGLGNLPIFASNCATYIPEVSVGIMKNNSADLGKHPNILKWKNKGVRMFSVDGGHNYDEVLNDLAVAYLTSLNEGVIIVDDFQHMGWDGVFNGTMEFLKGEFDGPYTKFVPLAIGGNKLFLVREDAKDLYKDLKGLTEEEYFKTVNNTLTDKKVRAIIENYPGVVLFPEQQYQFTQNEFRI